METEYTVKVEKLTDINLLRSAASFTTGNECKMSLKTAYKNHHSLIRTQQFWIELCNIPLFVASQLVRSHEGVQFFQRSKRTDRGGEDFNDVCRNIGFNVGTCWIYANKNLDDPAVIANALKECSEQADIIERLPEKFDRLAPTDLAFICNAEMLINTSHKRLCTKASRETRGIWHKVVEEIAKVDPDLSDHCVPQCIYRNGLCGEPRCCHYYESPEGKNELENYKDLFS
jgi:hypothetical protein